MSFLPGSSSDRRQNEHLPTAIWPKDFCFDEGKLIDFFFCGKSIYREKLLSQELVFVANTELLKQWMLKEGKYPVSLKQEPSIVFAECCPYLKRGLFFRYV